MAMSPDDGGGGGGGGGVGVQQPEELPYVDPNVQPDAGTVVSFFKSNSDDFFLSRLPYCTKFIDKHIIRAVLQNQPDNLQQQPEPCLDDGSGGGAVNCVPPDLVRFGHLSVFWPSQYPLPIILIVYPYRI